MTHYKKQKGFTLIELLVVISIIALLASVLFYSTNKVRKEARNARRMGDLSGMQKALELYFADSSQFIHGSFFSSTWQNTLGPYLSPYVGRLPTAPTNPDFPPLPITLQTYRYVGGNNLIVSTACGTSNGRRIVLNNGYWLAVYPENRATHTPSQGDGGIDPLLFELYGGNYLIQSC